MILLVMIVNNNGKILTVWDAPVERDRFEYAENMCFIFGSIFYLDCGVSNPLYIHPHPGGFRNAVQKINITQ